MSRAQDEFTVLYRRYYGAVARYVGRRVTADAARDVIADAFLVAWRRFDDFPTDDPLPWLYGIARWTVSNHVRSSGRAASLNMRLAAQPLAQLPSQTDAVLDQVTIAQAFDRLSSADQEVLRLTAWEDLEARAAAQVLGCSVSAFRMKLSRARKRLRAELRQLPTEPEDTPELASTSANWKTIR
jgi:RNA polymerase sigma factor (sigma-70 family)